MPEGKPTPDASRQSPVRQRYRLAAWRSGRRSPLLAPGVWRLASALLLLTVPAWGQVEAGEDPRGALILLMLLPIALVSFAALQLVLWVLAPGPLTATCQAIVRGRGRCLLTGCVTAIGVMVLVAALSPHPGAGAMVAALLLGLVMLGALTGVTAVAALLGQSAIELAGKTGSRALKVVAGSGLLALAGVFPFIGWVLFVYFILVGLGGAVLALGRSWKREK